MMAQSILLMVSRELQVKDVVALVHRQQFTELKVPMLYHLRMIPTYINMVVIHVAVT